MKLPKGCMISVLALSAELFAQPIALTGKVTDTNAKAIAGAIVTLKSNKLSDTTDATGAYSLSAPTSALQGRSVFPQGNAVTMENGALRLELAQQNRVRVEVFDTHGNHLAQVMDQSLAKGNYRVDAAKQAHSVNISFVRVTIGELSRQFMYVPVSGGNGAATLSTAASNSGLALGKSGAVDDALEASAVGFKPKSMPITSYTGTQDFSLESEFTGTCTVSKSVNSNVKGKGTHSVVVETNADAGIKEGTIYRPADLGPGKKYPIFVWGEGACSLNGSDNAAAMTEIASHGYFVIADGTPGGSGSRSMNTSDLDAMGKPALAYVTWAIAENRKPCSAYYQSLDTSKIGANGFSCGGLFSMGTAKDPRITTWGLNSSGSFADNTALWKSVHTPVLIVEGNNDNTGAHDNGLRDYNGIAPLGQPIIFISHKTFGHGGDLFSANGGEFTKIDLAWLNWWLKGDVGATGKGVLVGSTCGYCTNANWEMKSANIP